MKMASLAGLDLLLGSASPARLEQFFLTVFRGRSNPEEIKAALLLLAKKGEEANDLWGCLQAVRRLEPPRPVSLPFLIDVCGTGGDAKGTFNISTVSAFVIAGAGAYVAKHGNRAVSSRAGSSDLMESLGIRLDLPFSKMLRALHKYHLGYFHAPLYHASFAQVQGVRRQLGIRTLFNYLGPLVNPVKIRYQMIGVSNPQWLRPLAEALRRLGRERGAVVHSSEGLDELSTRETSDILYVERGRLRRFRLNPKRFGFSKAGSRDYEGGDLKTNRKIALGILEGRLKDPREEVVLLNSAFALWLTGRVRSLAEGIERSRWAIRTGRALTVLEGLRRFTTGKGSS